MNEKIKELYVEFHTKRRLKIERLTEERFQYYIAEGCNNSPAIHKDALYWAMEQISEEEQFSDFAELITKELLNISDEVISLSDSPEWLICERLGINHNWRRQDNFWI